MTSVHVARARDRFTTAAEGIETFHAFSFGAHYDPANTGFGVLAAHNDENLAPGAGFAAHPHRDQEIVTWVVAGTLEHRDAAGRRVSLAPGSAQWQGAGSGITHTEANASDREPLRFIQIWLTPDGYGLPPGYASALVELPPNRLVPVASGTDPQAALPMLRQRHASCHAVRTTPGARLDLPVARYMHLFVVRGAIALAVGLSGAPDGEWSLGSGDAARLTDPTSARVTCVAAAELLVWTMSASSADLLAPR
jgi:quercetin 2,3-dioxygenase